jgi:hypothetical protein
MDPASVDKTLYARENALVAIGPEMDVVTGQAAVGAVLIVNIPDDYAQVLRTDTERVRDFAAHVILPEIFSIGYFQGCECHALSPS